MDFYFNAPDRLEVACRLAAKAVASGKRLLVYAPQGDTAAHLERLMWTWQATGFVPHCMADDAAAHETPVLIAADENVPPACDLLLNLSRECAPHFERFERVLEVVSRDETDRDAGRERYRFYRDRGYPIARHDLAGGKSRGR